MRPAAILLLSWLLALGGCSLLPGRPPAPVVPPADVDRMPDAVPKAEPRSKYGNPDSYVVFGKRYAVMKSAAGFSERGIASWYGPDFHGKRTSSGERYDMYQMTAAHKTLPIPAYVEVVNLQNGRRAVVKVNDRGPFKDNRIIDLSYAAARKLGIWQQGTGLVDIRVVDPGAPPPGPPAAARVAAADQTLQFFVQVGAFFDRGNAERMLERVRQVAADARLTPGESNGQAVYRVQIGPFVAVEESDRIVQLLEGAGLAEHQIVLD
jgi:rare lipoprotein A